MIEIFPSRSVALMVGGFSIHWYGLMYLASFLLAWFLLPRLQGHRRLSLSGDDWSSIISWAVLGVIAGGRLGYVLFYDPHYYFAAPLKVFSVWEGGMAFHGGFIGVTLAIVYMAYRKGVSILAIADAAAVPVALGLVLGRIGNFINGELYGPVTALPWGVAFPGVEGVRHPTMLYEAVYSACIALCCFLHLRAPGTVTGRTCALFAILYGIFRTLTEFVRVQDYAFTTLGSVSLTRAQTLNVPMLIFGLILWYYAGRRSSGRSGGAEGRGRA